MMCVHSIGFIFSTRNWPLPADLYADDPTTYSKRQLCCASYWHLHKKNKIISPCFTQWQIFMHWERFCDQCTDRKLLCEGICFEEVVRGSCWCRRENLTGFVYSFLLFKWWRWKMPADLLALTSNPLAQQALKRITHRNFKTFIIFLMFSSLASVSICFLSVSTGLY
jgi:hypothetical protein